MFTQGVFDTTVQMLPFCLFRAFCTLVRRCRYCTVFTQSVVYTTARSVLTQGVLYSIAQMSLLCLLKSFCTPSTRTDNVFTQSVLYIVEHMPLQRLLKVFCTLLTRCHYRDGAFFLHHREDVTAAFAQVVLYTIAQMWLQCLHEAFCTSVTRRHCRVYSWRFVRYWPAVTTVLPKWPPPVLLCYLNGHPQYYCATSMAIASASTIVLRQYYCTIKYYCAIKY